MVFSDLLIGQDLRTCSSMSSAMSSAVSAPSVAQHGSHSAFRSCLLRSIHTRPKGCNLRLQVLQHIIERGHLTDERCLLRKTRRAVRRFRNRRARYGRPLHLF